MSAPAIVTVEREIAAPRERMFDARLDPEQAQHFLFATPATSSAATSMPGSAAAS